MTFSCCKPTTLTSWVRFFGKQAPSCLAEKRQQGLEKSGNMGTKHPAQRGTEQPSKERQHTKPRGLPTLFATRPRSKEIRGFPNRRAWENGFPAEKHKATASYDAPTRSRQMQAKPTKTLSEQQSRVIGVPLVPAIADRPPSWQQPTVSQTCTATTTTQPKIPWYRSV